MISLKDLNEKAIANLNDDFSNMVKSGSVKQMKLQNEGIEVPYSAENFRKAVKLTLEA